MVSVNNEIRTLLLLMRKSSLDKEANPDTSIQVKK